MNNSIQVTRSSMPGFSEFSNEIKELWDTCWLTNNGVKHRELENKLLKYLKVQNISLFTNGHIALENVLTALELSGEVITTPFTFASTTHAITRNNLTPVFCDINPEDYNVDTTKIECLINEKTSAILPVHVYGNVCEVEKIVRIAEKYNIKVIFDAAHAFGVEVGDRGIGDFGDASIFSFHATKVFNTIEGGSVTCKDKKLKEKLDILKNFGIDKDKSVKYIGGNGKMNEFCAAMGICNLRHIDKEIEKRKRVANRYRQNLRNIKGIKFVKEKQGIKSNYSYLPVLFDNYKKTRDMVFDDLRDKGIMSRKYFYPLTTQFECYKNKFTHNNLPVAVFVANNILTLPLYSDLRTEEIDFICEIIMK